MAESTVQFPGREVDAIATEIFPHLGVQALPLGLGLTDFSKYAPNPNSAAIVTTMVESGRGRRAQTLQGDRNTRDSTLPQYDTFAADAERIEQKQIKIFPDYYAMGEVDIPEAEASLLRDPRYINEAIIPAAFQGCVRQLLKDFYSWFNPFNFADNANSDSTGSGANTGITFQFRGRQMDYDDLDIGVLGDLETILFNELMPDETYQFICNADLQNGIAKSDDGKNLNWLLYAEGASGVLQRKKLLRIKNFDVHRVHFISGTNSRTPGTANTKVEKDGLLLSYLAPHVASTGTGITNGITDGTINPNFFGRNFTIPTPPGETGKTLAGTGTLAYKNLGNAEGASTALLGTQRVVGIGFSKRAMGVAGWSQFTASEIIGKNPQNVQTSFVTDPLTGFPFRIMVYYQPELHKYTVEISAWVGFAVADPRGAVFVIKNA